MKKNLLKITVLTIIFLIPLFFTSVKAATLSTATVEVKKDDNAIVTFKVDAAAKKLNFKVTYDTKNFEYVSCSESTATVENSNGVLSINYENEEKAVENIDLTFKAINATEKSEFIASDLNADTDKEIVVSKVEIKVTEESKPDPEPTYTWTDESKIKMAISKTGDQFLGATLTIEGLDEKSKYSIFLKNGSQAPNVEYSEENNSIKNPTFTSFKGLDVSSYFEKNEDIYIWIYESQMEKDSSGYTSKYVNKCLVNGKKIEKPALQPLGSRMLCYFFSNKTSSFLYEPHKDERKIKIKIGEISDISILTSIKNKEKDCLNKLLDYAKKANSIYTGSISLGTSDTVTKDLKLTHAAYYYVYMELDDENGKYIPVEDISLYQANVTSDRGVNDLYDYLSENFKWNLANGESQQPSQPSQASSADATTASTPLPNTGINATIICAIIIFTISTIIGIVQYKRYDYKY